MYNWRNYQLNESSGYDVAVGNEDIIEKLGEINIYDEKTKNIVQVNVTKLMKVCSDAVYKMNRDYPYLYQFMAKCKIMYIPVWPSQVCDTMCVDDRGNLWICFHFVYNTCKMDSNRVFGVLFHEMFHVFFDHLLRFNNKYPDSMFKGGLEGAKKKANMKANICMDYEVNASMVEDGIVDQNFFKRMNMLYKKEYTGMTWEEIMDKVGDKEYKDWLSRNGFSLDDIELKILDAIEKASKVLLDPTAEEEEKRAARRELQKTLDELLGKGEKTGDKSIQDELEELSNSKLGDIGGLKMDMEDVIDDLYKAPANMTDEELDKTLNDIDKMMDDMIENSDEIGNQFEKSSESVSEDVSKARESLKKAMEKLKEGGLSKEDKKDLIDKAKDDLEDIISNDVEKEKLKKKREERDAKKAAERKEKLKKIHPIRSIINVLKNFIGLKDFGLVSDKTVELAEKGMEVLDPLTEKYFKDMTEDDWVEPKKVFGDLKESFFPDLVALIDNETILNKTEDDMNRLLDGVFDFVFNAFDRALDDSIDEDAKGSLIKMAAQKMRIIGKILKTQKVWRVGDDFKEAYQNEMKRLLKLYKEEGDEALFRELLDFDVIEPMYLDGRGVELYSKIMGGDDDKSSSPAEMEFYHYSEDDDIKEYTGTVYYEIEEGDDGEVLSLALSSFSNKLMDSGYEAVAKRFEKDFPDYWVEEDLESIFSVMKRTDYSTPTAAELGKAIKGNPDYKPGDWR